MPERDRRGEKERKGEGGFPFQSPVFHFFSIFFEKSSVFGLTFHIIRYILGAERVK